ncbi:MAG: hypothetical protein ACFFAM_20090 [Promethearchaeota archaeon]
MNSDENKIPCWIREEKRLTSNFMTSCLFSKNWFYVVWYSSYHFSFSLACSAASYEAILQKIDFDDYSIYNLVHTYII